MGQFSQPPLAGARGAERRIYRMLRAQIEEGVLAQGTRLASTRALAAELAVSRTTVTAAYEQLAAEGFVRTSAGKAARGSQRHRRGEQTEHARSTRKEDAAPTLSLYGQRVAALQPYSMSSPLARIDFRYGAVASRDFPALGWRRAYRSELLQRQESRPTASPRAKSACAVRCTATCAARVAWPARWTRSSSCTGRSRAWTCAPGCC